MIGFMKQRYPQDTDDHSTPLRADWTSDLNFRPESLTGERPFYYCRIDIDVHCCAIPRYVVMDLTGSVPIFLSRCIVRGGIVFLDSSTASEFVSVQIKSIAGLRRVALQTGSF